MNEVVHADIFFFITSIAIVIISIFLIIALVYVIRIIKDLSHISEVVRKESDEIISDVAEFRKNVKTHSHSFKSIIMMFLKMIAPKKQKK